MVLHLTLHESQIVKPDTVYSPKPDFVKVYFSRFLIPFYVYFLRRLAPAHRAVGDLPSI